MPDIRNNTSIENTDANARTRYEDLGSNTYAIVRGLGGVALTALQQIAAALGGGGAVLTVLQQIANVVDGALLDAAQTIAIALGNGTDPQRVDSVVYVPNGTQRVVTVTNAVTPMPAMPVNTTHVQIQVQTADCRMTIDGTDPTAGGNFVLLEDGAETLWDVDTATAARFIRETATSSIIIAWPLRAAL